LRVDGGVVARAEAAHLVVSKMENYDRDDPSGFFGTMFVKDAEAARRIGVKHVRGGADWVRVEPARGRYSWDFLDGQVDSWREKKLSVLLVLRPESRPSWTPWKTLNELSQPRYMDEFVTYTRRVLDRYADRICAVEVINEPDLECVHGLGKGVGEGGGGRGVEFGRGLCAVVEVGV
jgi:beta-glucosidase/6-phospho-beta-glucosidase/beta-galactosidase